MKQRQNKAKPSVNIAKQKPVVSYGAEEKRKRGDSGKFVVHCFLFNVHPNNNQTVERAYKVAHFLLFPINANLNYRPRHQRIFEFGL
jgi:hypothetical protein